MVRHVKEGEVRLGEHGLADSLPLLGRGVDTRGVVRARVQEEEASRGRVVDVLEECVVVERARVFLVVAQALKFDATVAEDVVMVAPRWRGHEALRVRREAVHEVRHQTARSGTAESLHGGDSVFLDALGVFSVREFDGLVAERLESSDGQILHEVLSCDAPFRFPDAVEHDGFSIVVAVRPDAKVEFLRVRISEKLLRDS